MNLVLLLPQPQVLLAQIPPETRQLNRIDNLSDFVCVVLPSASGANCALNEVRIIDIPFGRRDGAKPGSWENICSRGVLQLQTSVLSFLSKVRVKK